MEDDKNKGIDAGDEVLHAPSGETWIVAAVEGGRLYWCGWPFGGSADLADCSLVEKATDEARDELLHELAARATAEQPVLLARLRLEAARA